MKYTKVGLVLAAVFGWLVVVPQPAPPRDFLTVQKSFKRVDEAFSAKEQLLQDQFKEKGLAWPAKYLYIRSFKFDSQLEVWVKQTAKEKYRLFKTYKVCALAGNLGPKRFEGDYQVPEGFYYLNEFKPNSQYTMALGVSYPNASDRVLSDSIRPGSDIYIHGSCVTVGCIPVTDEPIKELYVLAASTHHAGQDFIPIHIFPIKFHNAASRERLEKYLQQHVEYAATASVLEKTFYYFNEHRNLPTILIGKKGEYMLAQPYTIPLKPLPPAKFVENTAPRRPATKVVNFPVGSFFSSVYKQPAYPGGLPALQAFIDQLAADLAEYMPDGKKRVFVQVDFVVNTDGMVVNTVVASTANNEMNNLIIERFEQMPLWSPALRPEIPVPIKLIQTIVVEAKPKAAPPPPPPTDEYEQ
jgi:murein L,D-transpeptidase YafK